MADSTGTGGVDDSLKGIKESTTGILDDFANALNENLTGIKETIFKVDEAATNIAIKFGQSNEQLQNIKVSLADASTSIFKLGGSFEELVSIQEQAANVLGRNVVLTSDSYEKLFAAQKVSGIQVDVYAKSMKDVGISLYQSGKEMETVVNRAREIGVSAQAVSSQVVENMGMMNKYTFKNGVDGLAKMAAQAVNLRINVNEMSATLDKAFNPEDAIEMAASLQRLGATQSDLLDPLRLMDLAQNDPAELQNQIAEMSKQFVTLNEKGQFEILPGAKRQMIEIEKAMGMSQGTLSRMALSSAELGDKMSKIRFPDTFTEEQKTMIANMAEMGEGGTYRMKLDGEDMGMEDAIQKIQSMSKEDQEAFFKAQKPVDVSKLAEEQLSVEKSQEALLMQIRNRLPMAAAGAKATGQFTEALKKDMGAIGEVMNNEMLSVSKVREKLNELTDGLAGSFKDGKVNFDELSKAFGDFGKYMDETFIKTIEEANDKFGGILNEGKKSNEGNKTDGKTTETKVETVKTEDFLKIPGKKIEFLPQDTIMGMTKGPEFLEKLGMLNNPMSGGKNETTETKSTNNINLTIEIKSDKNVTKSDIMAVLNQTDTIRTLNKNLETVMNNNGLTA